MSEKLDQLAVAEPHPIFSAIIDMYLLEMFIGVISSFTMYFVKINFLEEFFLLLGIALLIISIIYHAIYAKKIMWLSPGEIIGGKEILDKGKVWTNPYEVNRIGLFFICILSLLLFRNSDAIIGDLTSIPEIFGFLIKTIIITYCITLIGKGNLIGIAIINIILLISFGLSMLINNDEIRFSGYVSLGVFIVFTIIGVIYHNIRLTQTTLE